MLDDRLLRMTAFRLKFSAKKIIAGKRPYVWRSLDADRDKFIKMKYFPYHPVI